MLELKDIKKSYIVGDVKQQVLKGIDIKFRRSEFASILELLEVVKQHY